MIGHCFEYGLKPLLDPGVFQCGITLVSDNLCYGLEVIEGGLNILILFLTGKSPGFIHVLHSENLNVQQLLDSIENEDVVHPLGVTLRHPYNSTFPPRSPTNFGSNTPDTGNLSVWGDSPGAGEFLIEVFPCKKGVEHQSHGRSCRWAIDSLVPILKYDADLITVRDHSFWLVGNAEIIPDRLQAVAHHVPDLLVDFKFYALDAFFPQSCCDNLTGGSCMLATTKGYNDQPHDGTLV